MTMTLVFGGAGAARAPLEIANRKTKRRIPGSAGVAPASGRCGRHARAPRRKPITVLMRCRGRACSDGGCLWWMEEECECNRRDRRRDQRHHEEAAEIDDAVHRVHFL